MHVIQAAFLATVYRRCPRVFPFLCDTSTIFLRHLNLLFNVLFILQLHAREREKNSSRKRPGGRRLGNVPKQTRGTQNFVIIIKKGLVFRSSTAPLPCSAIVRAKWVLETRTSACAACHIVTAGRRSKRGYKESTQTQTLCRRKA